MAVFATVPFALGGEATPKESVRAVHDPRTVALEEECLREQTTRTISQHLELHDRGLHLEHGGPEPRLQLLEVLGPGGGCALELEEGLESVDLRVVKLRTQLARGEVDLQDGVRANRDSG